MQDCLFCKIVQGEIPSAKVYEDASVLAFKDIDPQAPVHLLVIPKAHIASVASVEPSNAGVLVEIFVTIAKLAAEMGLEQGFRVVSNSGVQAQQSVPHLHFHVLGGRDMTWPPG